MIRLLCVAVFSLVIVVTAVGGPADVEDVSVRATGSGTYHFSVTVRHTDEGWDHYADRWEVPTPDGILLGTRILYHPHVDEQPFTRELGGVSIPDDIKTVMVKAHDSVHGYSGVTQTIALPGR